MTSFLTTAFLLLSLPLLSSAVTLSLDVSRLSLNGATGSMHGADLDIVFSRSPKGWPSATVALPRSSAYVTEVRVCVSLIGGESDHLSLRVNDTKGERVFRRYRIEKGRFQTLILPLNKEALDRNSLKNILLYLSHPQHSATFRVRSIHLVDQLASQLEALERRLQGKGMGEEAGRLSELKSLLAEGRVDKEEVRKRLRALEHEVSVLEVFRRTRELYPHAGIGITAFSCLEKAMPDGHFGIPGTTPRKLELSLARRESEMIQLATIAPLTSELRNLRIKVSEFRHGESGKRLSQPVTVAPVGLVTIAHTKMPNPYYGRYPDPICEFTDCVPVVKAGEIQSWVVRCRTTPEDVAGDYEGEIRIASDLGTATLPMRIHVYRFCLPETPSFRAVVSVYGSKVLGEHRKSMEQWILKHYHLNPFSIYSREAYGEPDLPEISEYAQARKAGLNFIPIVYLKLPRQALHTDKGMSPRASRDAWKALSKEEQSVYPAYWKERYGEILRKRIPALKRAGLWRYAACYGFDEAIASEWPACVDLMRTLKAEFPDLKIISTLKDDSYGESPEANQLKPWLDGWIPQVWKYDRTRAAAARHQGKEIWYYTMSLTIDFFKLHDIRAQLGSLAFASGVDGWLVWTVSRWFNNPSPIVSVPDTGWNPESDSVGNGSGSYFCMGPSGQVLPTLRAEAIRDGIEDYEYFAILRRLAQARSTQDPLRIQAEDFLNKLPGGFRKTSIAKELGNRQKAALLIEGLL